MEDPLFWLGISALAGYFLAGIAVMAVLCYVGRSLCSFAAGFGLIASMHNNSFPPMGK